MRESGILYPILSLSSKYGIGCFSKEAFAFVDFLKEAGQGYWQILPLGPTGFGDSPYQSFSAFAGNPYFISPEVLVDEGLLTCQECDSFDFGNDCERVDYGALYENRFKLLRLAYGRFVEKELDKSEEYLAFLKKAEDWLEDYCLYMALKEKHNGADWLSWKEEYRTRKPDAIKAAKKELADTIAFFQFQQYEFSVQWDKLHAYATRKNVKIIGDVPFYVAPDSADAWSHPEVFLMDKDLYPSFVAGCKPDEFSPKGQLWGNPIYDWDALAENGYEWWIKRIERNYELFDAIRIDHFHGFAEYYVVPYGDETAENGTSKKGPGMDFFKALEKKLGKLNGGNCMKIIAEDLGTVTEENVKLLRDSGIPGMQILQYAFTCWDSIYITHKHTKNSVVYTGTHDNMPTLAWIEDMDDGSRDFTRRYLNSMHSDYGALVWEMIREAYRSVADLCIIPIQDYLVKGREARMNCPTSQGSNWQWRMEPDFLSAELAKSIRNLAEIYGRIPVEKETEAEKAKL